MNKHYTLLKVMKTLDKFLLLNVLLVVVYFRFLYILNVKALEWLSKVIQGHHHGAKKCTYWRHELL